LPAVGQPRRRVEDQRLLVGAGAYVEDLRPERSGLLHIAFVRSPLPSAAIRGLDTSAASAAPGVVRVVTATDVAHLTSLPPPGPPFLPGFPAAPQHPVLAHDRVRFVGEPVAAVVAESAALAEDARDLVEVDSEPLPAVADLEAALRSGAPLVHAEYPGNVLATRRHVAGDPDGAFAAADRVVHLRLRHNRVASVAMEPRGILADYDVTAGRLNLWMSTQAPFLARADLARTLGLAEEQLRVIVPDVGGGFGAKVGAHREDVLVAQIALDLRRPVAWVATRSEDMLATFHGRDMLSEVDVAARADGTLLALRVRTWSNIGAYALWHGPLPVQRLINYSTGCYRIEHLDTEVTTVFTNTLPSGPYRGAGRPEAAFVAERAADAVAAELGLDPAEVRRRNFILPEAFPYTTAGGVTYDSGDYGRALELALQRADYLGLRQRQAARRQRGEVVGIGLATYTEVAGGGFESGSVSLAPDGVVTAVTGVAFFGQGHQTSLGQIVADRLGVDPSVVRVVAADTDALAAGMGSFGSRSTVLGGSALAEAAGVVRDRALRAAAALLEAAPEDLELRDGRVAVRGAAERSIDLASVAAAVQAGVGLGPDEPRELGETVRFASAEGDTFPFGAIVAAVSIEPDTGRVILEGLVLVDDCGRAINPLLVDGQLTGGAAQGIGEALLELVVYGPDGQLLTGSLLDYAVPRADAIPSLELDRSETPSPRNPLGAKGVGESATVGTPAAIANAAVDALRSFGVRDVELPITTEQVWRLMHAPAA
jgi:aerobic carbon-monoxide dehydrogenase large subunit